MSMNMTGLIGLAAIGLAAAASGQGAPALVFEPLPYAYDALEPYIDAQTMEIHYSKHHQAYFNNLVKAVAGTAMEGKAVEALFPEISKLPVAVRNNGGGHWNHTFFWNSMAPNAGGTPEGALLAAIEKSFGSFDEFKKQFEAAAVGRFGSGWAWLAVDANGSLFVSSTPNQDNPLMDVVEKRGTPILGVDVWEHAYYLKYQNLRASYVSAFWNVVNWPEVAKRYAATQQ
ncbi:MAG TPA: superoxide dismutase [Kiritimatiellia bacterium]|mgnify:FL=1|jgi:Fe-Mn family superoxide dismutase|nr:MAG: Superoxide dismutase (Mn) [Verrucomicrobia bacterium ADurb.Bin018]HOD99586.1 superoxide dismutase [Kiritimatiellia bacterium]HOE36526.1 superoxide dismutase [Kiritimatiellia bacterium]HOR73571.1 superoxide dismutase [Kiritimatiellia bacterium]HOU58042.1 superoxide dismutase [Kiritimatiellia bacterium]